MAKWRFEKMRLETWDGNPKTGPEWGFGDYPRKHWDFIDLIEAASKKSAMSIARKIAKRQGWECYFSGSFPSACLREIKEQLNEKHEIPPSNLTSLFNESIREGIKGNKS